MAHHQPSPTAGLHPHHGIPNGHVALQQQPPRNVSQFLAQTNEAVWLQIGMLREPCNSIPMCLLIQCEGQLNEMMGDLDNASDAFENALRANANSIQAMQAISCILRTKDQFPAAVEYLKNILKLEHNNGDTWSSLGMHTIFIVQGRMLTT